MMGLLDGIVANMFGKATPIADRSALGRFMDSRAAFLAQKCVVEFCRVRAGVNWQKLFEEDDFQRALAQSRWRSYPPAFAMVAEMVEAALREPAGLGQRRLPAALEAVAADVFAAYAVPQGESETFWQSALDEVRERLAATQSGPPRPVREMPDPLARRIFDALPLHRTVVTNDYDYIFNNLRMNLLRAHEDFLAAARLESLVDDLLGTD